jgi:hypothetical protein
MSQEYDVVGRCDDCDAWKKISKHNSSEAAKETAKRMVHNWHGEHKEATGHEGGKIYHRQGPINNNEYGVLRPENVKNTEGGKPS